MNGSTINNAKADRRPVVEQCNGCERVLSADDSALCSAFAFPDTKWRLGPCSMATHIKSESANAEKKRVGQQKQKKH